MEDDDDESDSEAVKSNLAYLMDEVSGDEFFMSEDSIYTPRPYRVPMPGHPPANGNDSKRTAIDYFTIQLGEGDTVLLSSPRKKHAESFCNYANTMQTAAEKAVIEKSAAEKAVRDEAQEASAETDTMEQPTPETNAAMPRLNLRNSLNPLRLQAAYSHLPTPR